MAECDTAERDRVYGIEDVVAAMYDVEPQNVITGDSDSRRFLYYQLKMSMEQATQIDIIVSFLMESGIKMIINDLKRALARGCKVRILTGNYLGITQPAALYLLKDCLGEQVDLRFYNEPSRSFHAKAYIFHNRIQREIYVGSSNISRSALTSAIEWNYHFTDQNNPTDFQNFYNTFQDLFEHHTIKVDDKVLTEYAKDWHKPAIHKDLAQYEKHVDEAVDVIDFFQPRGVQIEALYALKQYRKEGANKALICAATGIGKTYLAAFDSVGYKRILFVAHREEILRQAAESFVNVRKSTDYGFFNGQSHDTNNEMIFASVESLGKEKHLREEFFGSEAFDYIVIDEFHHAVNKQYRMIIEYFHPKFMLGLTATPERMDGRDIYELCDYVVPYTITLQSAINKGVLVPFHYYGIYDNTVDYGELHIVGGKYDIHELDMHLIVQQRQELVYNHYMKYKSKAAIGFCCSRIHAEKMAEAFTERGIKAASVYSDAHGQYSLDRMTAISQMKRGDLQVIFAVDMFNEGVDIPNIDMVMFLRPTESPVVFLQQLGRGLRICSGKNYLTVLDFIGNYKKAENIPFLLSGEPFSRVEAHNRRICDYVMPDDCQIDFDLKVLDIFKLLSKKSMRKKDIIQDEYSRIKGALGRIPTRMELFNHMEDEIYTLCRTSGKNNPFKHYLSFLEDVGDIDFMNRKLQKGVSGEFLNSIETTNMTKSYKMPVLLAFYNSGNIKMAIDEEDLYQSFKTFYSNGLNWKDIAKEGNYEEFLKWDRKQYIKKAVDMPVHYLLESGKGFFVKGKKSVLELNEQLEEYIHLPGFAEQMKDIIDYRTVEYYRMRQFAE